MRVFSVGVHRQNPAAGKDPAAITSVLSHAAGMRSIDCGHPVVSGQSLVDDCGVRVKEIEHASIAFLP